MTISRYLFLGLAYPFDFGFFPSTSAEVRRYGGLAAPASKG
jgi:hypothetical protein